MRGTVDERRHQPDAVANFLPMSSRPIGDKPHKQRV
jgi:hypothetical protein